jgi:hypothetical protein
VTVRLPWDKRGTVTLHQLPDKAPATLRRLSDSELHQFIAGWKPGSADWIAGDAELKRRHNGLARWALAVSILSLLVAIAALFAKGG